jgi:crotonobetainyl-CoA:carnitine CoA-transferase CaiB-like acyl-CoA transferase
MAVSAAGFIDSSPVSTGGMTKALSDVTIADFSQMMQGPWATQKLADMGAETIKIEPTDGDWQRKQAVAGELHQGESPWFLAFNRNKRSVAIDLQNDDGLQAALDIVAEADVMVENFRPGSMDRLGLGYEDVRKVNPEIIYVTSSGWGEDGPYVDRPAVDLMAQAMSGVAANAGKKGEKPVPAGTFVGDQLSGMNIALYVVIALYHRELTGEGQKVEINMLNSLLDAMCGEVASVLNMDREFERSEEGVGSPFFDEPYGIYETADGYVALAVFTPPSVKSLAETFDLQDLQQYDTREKMYENRDTIKRLVEEYTRTRETDSFLEDCFEADVWASGVRDITDVEDDPQVQHNEMLTEFEHPTAGSFRVTNVPVELSETPGEIESPPPLVGEHSVDVLREHGYDRGTIGDLVERGVVKRPEC